MPTWTVVVVDAHPTTNGPLLIRLPAPVLDALADRRRLSVRELASDTDVTIRRDLRDIEVHRLIRRVQRGVAAVDGSALEPEV